MYINVTGLLLAIYVIFFPIVAKLLNFISPLLTTCVYKGITGKNCPLCGGTRYISNIFNALKDPLYLIHPFGFIVMFIVFEMIFRIFCICRIKKQKPLKAIIVFDIIIHFIALIFFVMYEILFILNV